MKTTFFIFGILQALVWGLAGVLVLASNGYGYSPINVVFGVIFLFAAGFLYAKNRAFLQFLWTDANPPTFAYYELVFTVVTLFLWLAFFAAVCSRFLWEKMSVFG